MRSLATVVALFWMNLASAQGGPPNRDPKQIAADVKACASRLTSGKVNSLDVESVGFLIENVLGEGPLPAQFERQYVRRASGDRIASLIFRVDLDGDGDRRLQVILNFEGLTDDQVSAIVPIIKDDLNSRQESASVYARQTRDGLPAGSVARSFNTITGYRHPLLPTEASALFIHMDAILAYRLDDARYTDRFQSAATNNPGQKF